MYDYVIIGAGVVGSAIARELSKYELKLLVLEKESDIANAQTIANSAIVHSGHDPKPGTLKAELCVRGNELYEELEHELGLPLLYSGGYVVANDEDGLKLLDELYNRSNINGVPVNYISKEELLKSEPNLSETIIKAISIPSTKVTFPWETTLAFIENAVVNGVELKRNAQVTGIKKVESHYVITINKNETIQTNGIINAAGLYSDTIAGMIETKLPFVVTPRKGEYFVLGNRAKDFVSHVIYPLPTKAGKGVLLTPQVHGELLVGPTSEYILDKEDVTTTVEGLNKIKDQVKRLSETVPYQENIRTFSGVRASIDDYDFYIKESEEHKRIYHLGGIDSPGLTSAPAIAEYVRNLIETSYGLTKKDRFISTRVAHENFHNMPREKQLEKFKESSKYGNLVCKCERVTEQDILNAIHSPVGADTIKSVKKRVRAGAGMCQGGYCENTVLRILARELNVPKTSINYYQQNTPILMEETKVTK